MNSGEVVKPLVPEPMMQAPVPTLARWASDSLFAGRRELLIVHNGEEYRLRITRQEKLILTK